MAQQAERSPIEDAELPSTPSGSFFQPLPMARHWLRFFTPAEGQKFTPTNPKNHEYLTSLAIILIDSKNYPCFRPFFSQFLPFATPPKTALNRPSRLAFSVRFFSRPTACQLGFVFPTPPHPQRQASFRKIRRFFAPHSRFPSKNRLNISPASAAINPSSTTTR